MSSDDSSIGESLAPPKGHKLLDEIKGAWRNADKARYDYCALESERHIRLLHMIIKEPEPLPRLKIIHVSLDSAPDFEALSYRWGDDTQLYHIPIETDGDSDTRSISSTDSLATAMVFLPRSCSTGYIWIDQICINQQDDNERGHQIALMGDIYSRAKQVLVWFGPGIDVGNGTRHISACSTVLQPVIIDDSGTNLEDLMGFGGVRDLLENEWFQRAWMVQESCLANKKRALVGKFSMRWWNLLNQAKRTEDEVDKVKLFFHLGTNSEWSRIKFVADNKPREFCGFLVRYGRKFQASNPKDKILAFLGLWKPPDFDTKAAARREETVANVYTRFAVSLIKHTKGLDVLAAVHHKPSGHEGSSIRNDLPSWVPGWEFDADSNPSPLFQFQRRTRMDSLAHEWDASLSRNHQYQFDTPTAAELRTRGRILWKISCVSQQIKDVPCAPDNLAETEQTLGLDTGGQSVAVLDALRILLLCKRLKRAVKFADFEPELKGRRGIAIFRQCFLDGKMGPERSNQIEGLPEYDASLELEYMSVRLPEYEDLSDSDRSEFFWTACDLAFYRAIGRRFFKTQRPWNNDVEGVEGRAGLGPGCIETGDEIAILHGAIFPVVLRKIKGKEQRYQFIGDCYVDGVMFGEAVDWVEEDADDIILI